LTLPEVYEEVGKRTFERVAAVRTLTEVLGQVLTFLGWKLTMLKQHVFRPGSHIRILKRWHHYQQRVSRMFPLPSQASVDTGDSECKSQKVTRLRVLFAHLLHYRSSG